jgi:hypothetical protein
MASAAEVLRVKVSLRARFGKVGKADIKDACAKLDWREYRHSKPADRSKKRPNLSQDLGW